MSETEFRQAIHASNQDPIPRDIVLQVCLVERGAASVLQRLYREMEIIAPLLARDRAVVMLRFEDKGLACLKDSERSDLLQSLARHFALAVNAQDAPAVDVDSCDVLGLGPGAVSHFGDCLALNASDPMLYCRSLDQGRLPIVDIRHDPH